MTNRKTKRVISGLLAIVTVLSALIQPAMAFAEESEPAAYEAEYPALETVRLELAEDEIVTAGDYEVEVGSSFDVEHDFSGMEIPEEKVQVKFHEAKNQSGQDFDMNRADTYKAIYFVGPVSGNPSYHVCRNIIVKEKAETSQTGGNSANGQEEQSVESGQKDEESDPDSDSETAPEESMTEVGMEAVIGDMEQSEEFNEDAEKIEEDGGLLLYSMDTRMSARMMARSVSGTASLVTGQEVYYPSNLGNYSTREKIRIVHQEKNREREVQRHEYIGRGG